LLAYYNPYYDSNFLSFLATFFSRFFLMISGQLSLGELASDEIQIIVLGGVSLSGAIVGSFLVLRKMAMLANSISHAILVGIVIAFMLTRAFMVGGDPHHQFINIQVMLLAALMMGIFTSLMTEFLTKTIGLQEDASMGLVFTSFFAIGIILVTVLTRNAHIGAEVVMGNVDALHVDDCVLVLYIFLLNLALLLLFFKEYQITTFDPSYASALGISSNMFNYLLMVQASLTIVSAFRAVGVLMVLTFFTGPPLAARLITHDLKRMIALAMAIGSLASVCGVAISRHLLSVHGVALSTSGVVVATIVVFFICAAFFSSFKGRLHFQVKS